MENIRDFLALLRDRDDLATIYAEVSSELEITEITERTIRSKGPALLFKNVSGSNIPVVIIKRSCAGGRIFSSSENVEK